MSTCTCTLYVFILLGTYSKMAASFCISCPPGHFCPSSYDGPIPCPEGAWSPGAVS